MKKYFVGSCVLALLSTLNSCALLRKAPEVISVEERLGHLSKDYRKQLKDPASTLRFNSNLIPYVISENDEDAAFLLGVSHAYLRGFQLELLRRVSQGRLSESMGPFTRDLDHALKVFNFGKISPEIVRRMPHKTRVWMDSFVSGLNQGIKNSPTPFEFKSLGLNPDPWTLRDLVTVTRLMAADVNWFAWIRSLTSKDPQETWKLAQLEQLLLSLSKSGSNTWVAGADLTQNSKPMIANDPHVGVLYPNLWILFGIHSPSIKAVGMGLPGIPFVLLGRNKDMAWGGTNMRALSTEFYDIQNLDESDFKTKEERIIVKYWFDKKIKIRETAFGPVLSDAAIFKNQKNVFSVKWMGHEWSDELTAFYKMNQATDAEEYRNAFESYAVSAQNFLFADINNNIGHVLATRMPQRNYQRDQFGPLLEAKDKFKWGKTSGSTELPFVLNPPKNYLVSANDRPQQASQELGMFFSPKDRYGRIVSLFESKITKNQKVSLKDFALWQQDVYSEKAHSLSKVFYKNFVELDKNNSLKDLKEWDGNFDSDSRGALLYSCLEALTAQEAFGDYINSDYIRELILLRGFDLNQKSKVSIFSRCQKGDFKKFQNWGQKHRESLSHPFSNIPLLGSSYRFYEAPASGSFDTILKRAHALEDGSIKTRYGATARQSLICRIQTPTILFFMEGKMHG